MLKIGRGTLDEFSCLQVENDAGFADLDGKGDTQ